VRGELALTANGVADDGFSTSSHVALLEHNGRRPEVVERLQQQETRTRAHSTWHSQDSSSNDHRTRLRIQRATSTILSLQRYLEAPSERGHSTSWAVVRGE
jgi:hypothetical protein